MTDQLASFTTLSLSETLLRALNDMEFTTPSPVQAQTIPHLLDGRDIIAQAQTGTGKTAAFALPILQNLDTHSPITQALILAPTRELAIQVAEQIKAFSRYQSNVTIAILCGGQEYAPQLTQLRKGAHIVVGTPGRVLDHMQRGSLKLGALKTFVLDEADEMLRMGFIEDVETVLSKLPSGKQMALFSATMPSQIRRIANNYLNNPVSVEIISETATVKAIEQRFIFISSKQKNEALLRLLTVEDTQGVIVFVRTKDSTEDIAAVLQKNGHRATALHGDISQAMREKIVKQFREGNIDILVATDIVARGVDVDRVTHVFNYDIPFDCESYVHRIGRTGRAGRSGVAVLFVGQNEARMLNNIERHTRQKIQKVSVPNDFEMEQLRQKRFVDSIKQRLNSQFSDEYKQLIQQLVTQENLEPAEIATALALLVNQDKPWHREIKQSSLNRFQEDERRFERDGGGGRQRRDNKGGRNEGRFERRDNRFGRDKDRNSERPDRNDRSRSSSSQRDFGGRGERVSDHEQEMFRIDIGRVHGVKPGNIVGAIANEAGLQSRFITRLKIHDDHSTVCLPRNLSKDIFRHLNKAWVCGRQLKITSLEEA